MASVKHKLSFYNLSAHSLIMLQNTYISGHHNFHQDLSWSVLQFLHLSSHPQMMFPKCLDKTEIK